MLELDILKDFHSYHDSIMTGAMIQDVPTHYDFEFRSLYTNIDALCRQSQLIRTAQLIFFLMSRIAIGAPWRSRVRP